MIKKLFAIVLLATMSTPASAVDDPVFDLSVCVAPIVPFGPIQCPLPPSQIAACRTMYDVLTNDVALLACSAMQTAITTRGEAHAAAYAAYTACLLPDLSNLAECGATLYAAYDAADAIAQDTVDFIVEAFNAGVDAASAAYWACIAAACDQEWPDPQLPPRPLNLELYDTSSPRPQAPTAFFIISFDPVVSDTPACPCAA